ncbi:acetolactate synthase [Gigaspora margarita]|uniref:Acetolactate synthase n=1 Tax=Gigaspora margarita TaxID=4874 RepID=A0A8H4AF53_GIGMA|nr:acetolactate synthase [Gigaspora margarita]
MNQTHVLSTCLRSMTSYSGTCARIYNVKNTKFAFTAFSNGYQRRRKATAISPSQQPQPQPNYLPPPQPRKTKIPLPPTPKPTPSPTTTTPIPTPAYDNSFVGLTGGQIFHEMMLRHGVEQVFGYPGGAILPVFDAIYNSKHFNFVLPRHEQGAGHMAEGYARASGKPGIVLVTSGPGATNVVTPMQDALSDGTPLIVFCGQVPTTSIGTDAFQEADVVGISRACTKWNVMVKDVADLPRRITEAFEIATTGRPGPVLVDLPKDMTASILKKPIPTQYTLPFRAFSDAPALASPVTNSHVIRHAAELINNAKRPIIYAGQGVLATSEGPARMRELAARGNIPVTTTLQGLGGFDELDPLSLHMLGMHGSAYANLAMQSADVIIGLGSRFDDRVTGHLDQFAPEAKLAAKEGRGGIIHFEISPKNINKVVQATAAIEGDVSDNLGRILPLIKRSERKEWFKLIDEWKGKYPWTYSKPKSPDSPLKPQQFIEELDRQTRDYKEKVLMTTGVGQHQMWAAQFFRWRYPRTMITSGGLGTMGYGLPAAIGAKVACPDKVVIDIDGDASFCMTGMELATAVQFNIGVKVLILNNDFQGMVKQWQDLFYEERYSQTEMVNPDFVKLAESIGAKALRIRTEEELPDKIAEFLEYNDGPIVCDAIIEKHEHVYPMVPAGKGLGDFIVHPDLRT